MPDKIADTITFVFSREQVESCDVDGAFATLSKLLTPDAALLYCESINLLIHGYDDDPRDLHEIDEVRTFIIQLDIKFPYWCYYLSKRSSSLYFVISCFCLPFRTPDERERLWPEQIGEYLTKRGFPAMNAICHAIGCSEAEIERMSDRVCDYLTLGVDHSEV